MVTYSGEWGKVPKLLRGKYTTEIAAKKAILQYLKQKYDNPNRRKKFKYKTAGRPVKALRTSKSCDPNHIHGNKLKWLKQKT